MSFILDWLYDFFMGSSVEELTIDLIRDNDRQIIALEIERDMYDNVHPVIKTKYLEFIDNQILIRQQVSLNLKMALRTKSTHTILQAQTKALETLNSFDSTRDDPRRARQENQLHVFVDEINELAPDVKQDPTALPLPPSNIPRISNQTVNQLAQTT
jgi:hypothetical protein